MLAKDILTIEHVNAQSLLSNLDEIKLLIHERKIDILCVTETWLLPHTTDVIISIPGYKLFRCDKGRGSGVCIYAKHCLNPVLIDTRINPHPAVEDIFIKVQCRKLPSVIIGSMYRHPKAHANSFDYISDVFRHMCILQKPVFILGDLNDNLLSANNKLSRVITSNKLTQLISSPTRTTSTSATLIDVIITNKPELVLLADVIPSVIADHDLVTVTANISKPKRTLITKTVRDFSNYNADVFCSSLLNQSHVLNNILQTDDTNKQVDILTGVFNECVDECAPMVSKVIRRPAAPWIDDNIRQAITAKNNAQQILKCDRLNEALRNHYKILKKHVKSLINKQRKQHYLNRLKESKGNIAATWRIVGDIVPSKKNVSEINFCDNAEQKAEEFNCFFANVGKSAYEETQVELSNENYNNVTNNNTNNSRNTLFRPQPVDVNTVVLTIKHLQNKQSSGSDKISLRFIKDSLTIIAQYLTIILNTSIVTGVVPSSWKHALVVPLHKSGDPSDTSNYRPISLLPVFSKILEKIVADQLVRYLEDNKILSESQHGFRPKLSTTTALTIVTDKIYQNMDKKCISLLTLCDLSKAFDSVSHHILLEKLKKVAIDTFWFNDYLDDRSQSVRLNNNISSKAAIEFGVPQGSILGPILFNIYVNDLSDYITNCHLVQYADDTQFIHTGTPSQLNLLISEAEQTLHRAREYFLKNGLKLNTKKTQCIFIGTRQLIPMIPEDTAITFHNTKIYPSSHVKNLGVHIDKYMTFDTHLHEITRKVIGTLLYINRVKHCFDKPTRIVVIQSLVLSLINYCNTIWGTTNTTLINATQKLQNFAIRVADGKARKYDHVTPIFQELKWLNVKNTCLFNTAVTVYKQLNNYYPQNVVNLPTVNDTTGSTTRQRYDLCVPRVNTQSGGRALCVRGPSLWNLLPPHIKKTTSLHSFKTKLRQFLLTNEIAL